MGLFTGATARRRAVDTKEKVALEQRAEYEKLCRQIASSRAELSETFGGIEDDDEFVATIRELDDIEDQ